MEDIEKIYLGEKLGKYEIVQIIGKGGMGVVYKGVHEFLRKEVAIKIILPLHINSRSSRRFLQEAKLLAELKHPNIVEVYDFDFTEDGRPYYVMEFLNGTSLKEALKNHPEGFDIKKFCFYIKQIVSGLSFAHKHGIIHRDLKPSNIFIASINDKPVIKILDFGIAKLVEPSKDDSTSVLAETSDSIIVGTPMYVSPEQVMKEVIGPYTDIYSLGLLAAEMLIGKPIRKNKPIGEIISVDMKAPLDITNLKQVPENIKKAIFLATIPDFKKRIQNADEFLKILCNENTQINDLRKELFDESSYTHTIPENLPLTKKEKISFLTKNSNKRNRNIFFIIIVILLLALGFIKYKTNIEKLKIKNHENRLGLSILRQRITIPNTIDDFVFLSSIYTVFLTNGIDYYTLNLKSFPKIKVIPFVLKKNEKLLTSSDNNGFYSFYNGRIYENFINEKIKKLVAKISLKKCNCKISPDGKFLAVLNNNSIKLYKIVNKKTKLLKKIEIKNNEKRISFFLSRKYFVFISGTKLKVYNLNSSKLTFKKSFQELISNFNLEINDRYNLIALGGWSDKVYIINLKKSKETFISFYGKTTALKFFDGTDLLFILKEKAVLIYRNGKIQNKYTDENAEFTDILLTHIGILVINKAKSEIEIFSYKEFNIKEQFKLFGDEIWSLKSYKELLFSGGAEGILKQINIKNKKVKKVFRFENGITWMLKKENYLIASSDDKTIGVFKLPAGNLIMRSKAHLYLINYLFDSGEKNFFWSSSSDGFIKKWTLPYLENIENIKIPTECSSAAFWKNEDVLTIGCWGAAPLEGKFLMLKRVNKNWVIKRKINLQSRTIYQIVYLKKLDIIIGIGVLPSNIYIYDIKNENLYRINANEFEFTGIVKYNDNSVLLGGNVFIGKFEFNRIENRIIYKSFITINTNINISEVIIKIVPNSLVVGNAYGKVLLINIFDLNFKPLPYEKPVKLF